MAKVLFILKRREDYSQEKDSKIGLSTGLFNSANFMNEMLNASGISSSMEVVIDNNDIDRVVTAYRPTYAIIEALWVTPEKFSILQKLHPSVKWVIRLHSEMPFMAGEGIAMEWVGNYSSFRNVIIACNAPRMLKEIQFYLKMRNNWNDIQVNEKVIYLNNFYPQNYESKSFITDKEIVDVSCFVAVRPLKNHLVQAFAALEFAEKIKKKLNFHVNFSRVEMNGSPVIHNLKGLFSEIHKSGHLLINHEWTPREEFLKTCAKMDIGMQVSFSETFNIVGADHISQGVPIVGSTEIPWAISEYCADPTNSEDISKKLLKTYRSPVSNVKLHQGELTKYTNNTREIWYNYFKGE